MKKTALIAFAALCITSVTAFGQTYSGAVVTGYNPEQVAREQTGVMARELNLTPQQTKKVYRQNLREARRGNASRLYMQRNNRNQSAYRSSYPSGYYRNDDYGYRNSNREPNRYGYNNREYNRQNRGNYSAGAYGYNTMPERDYPYVPRSITENTTGNTVYSTPNGNRVTTVNDEVMTNRQARRAYRQGYMNQPTVGDRHSTRQGSYYDGYYDPQASRADERAVRSNYSEGYRNGNRSYNESRNSDRSHESRSYRNDGYYDNRTSDRSYDRYNDRRTPSAGSGSDRRSDSYHYYEPSGRTAPHGYYSSPSQPSNRSGYTPERTNNDRQQPQYRENNYRQQAPARSNQHEPISDNRYLDNDRDLTGYEYENLRFPQASELDRPGPVFQQASIKHQEKMRRTLSPSQFQRYMDGQNGNMSYWY